MNTPVISALTAKQLNEKVQKEIDPRLFLFCNYEPTISYAISEDGIFLTNIQDLYKFTIDCSCILKKYSRFFGPNDYWIYYKRLREIIALIETLRSVTDHNQCELNGKIAQIHLNKYTWWIQDVIKKPSISSLEDFKKLNQELSTLSKELIAIIDNFISVIGSHTDKTILVDRWIDITLQWYCNNTKTEIYTGLLMDTYIANSIANGRNRQEFNQTYRLYGIIKGWIQKAIFFPIEKESQAVVQKLISLESDLKTVKVQQESSTSIPEEIILKVKKDLEAQIQQCHDKQTLLLQNKADLTKEINGKYLDYFFKHLEQNLRNTMSKLECEGIPYTLLPQDLLQENIEIFFGEVPSPNGDF